MTAISTPLHLTKKSPNRLRKMKTLDASGKTAKQLAKQLKNWFNGNPNRRVIKVKTSKDSFNLASRIDYLA